jgi:hypothetical protein
MAQTLTALRAARVISLKQSIIERKPNWSDAEVDGEVAAIEAEFGAQDEVDDPGAPVGEPPQSSANDNETPSPDTDADISNADPDGNEIQ